MLVKIVYTGQIENKVKDTWDSLVGTIHCNLQFVNFKQCKGAKRNYACYMQHVFSSQLEMEQLTDAHRIASNWHFTTDQSLFVRRFSPTSTPK